jgi:hypothetical protein
MLKRLLQSATAEEPSPKKVKRNYKPRAKKVAVPAGATEPSAPPSDATVGTSAPVTPKLEVLQNSIEVLSSDEENEVFQ